MHVMGLQPRAASTADTLLGAVPGSPAIPPAGNGSGRPHCRERRREGAAASPARPHGCPQSFRGLSIPSPTSQLRPEDAALLPPRVVRALVGGGCTFSSQPEPCVRGAACRWRLLAVPPLPHSIPFSRTRRPHHPVLSALSPIGEGRPSPGRSRCSPSCGPAPSRRRWRAFGAAWCWVPEHGAAPGGAQTEASAPQLGSAQEAGGHMRAPSRSASGRAAWAGRKEALLEAAALPRAPERRRFHTIAPIPTAAVGLRASPRGRGSHRAHHVPLPGTLASPCVGHRVGSRSDSPRALTHTPSIDAV